MSDNMTKRAKEYMNADFVYEDYKNLAEAQKIADVEDVTESFSRKIVYRYRQNDDRLDNIKSFIFIEGSI